MVAADEHPSIPSVLEAETVPEFDYEDITTVDKIGVGGDANVYLATIRQNTETFEFGLKEPRFEGTVQTDIFERFEGEARTWSSLDEHQNVVSVHGFGASSIPWIALEYMDGGTVASQIEEIEFEAALWMAGRIAEGIRHGHRHGVAHLDLKPTNVLLRETPDGKWNYPKVSDWGLAKMLLEQSNGVEGLSPTYAAPEQFDADEYGRADDITDIYQFGAIVYELLTGRPPFTGSPTNVMQSVLDTAPTKPSAVNPALPAEVDEVIVKALAKNKDARYDSILVFQKQLDQLFYDYATELEVDVEAPKNIASNSSVGVSETDTTGSEEPTKTQAGDGTATSQAESPLVTRRTVLATVGVAGAVGGGLYATRNQELPVGTLFGATGGTDTPHPETLSRDSFDNIWREDGYTSFLFPGETNFYLKEWVSETEWSIRGVNFESGETAFEAEPFDDNRYRRVMDSSSVGQDNDHSYIGTTWNASDTPPNNAKLMAVDRSTGELQWEYETPSGGQNNRIRNVESTDSKVLFTANWNAQAPPELDEQNPLVFAINKNTGEQLWRSSHSSDRGWDIRDISVHQNNLYMSRGGGIDVRNVETGDLKYKLHENSNSKFLISEGVLYNFEEVISALRLSDRTIVWDTESPTGSSAEVVTTGESTVYGAESNVVFEIDKSSGELTWSTPLNSEVAEMPGALAVSDSTVWVSDSNGNVYVLNRDTGEQLFSLSDEQEQYYRPMACIDDVVCVGGNKALAYTSHT